MKNQFAPIIPLALAAVATLLLFGVSLAGPSRVPLDLLVIIAVAYAISFVWFVLLAIQDRRKNSEITARARWLHMPRMPCG